MRSHPTYTQRRLARERARQRGAIVHAFTLAILAAMGFAALVAFIVAAWITIDTAAALAHPSAPACHVADCDSN